MQGEYNNRVQGSQPGRALSEYEYKQRSLHRAAEYKRMMKLQTGGAGVRPMDNNERGAMQRYCIIHDSRSHSTADCDLVKDLYQQPLEEPAHSYRDQTGHLCPHRTGKLIGRSAPKIELTLIGKDGSVAPNYKEDTALFLEVVIEGEEYRGMVDTGASNCFMSKAVRDSLPAEAIWDTILSEDKSVRCGNQTQAYINETVRIRCSLDGIYVYYNFHIMETLAHPIIIGRDLLRDLQAVVNAAEGTVSLFNGNPVSVTKGVHIMPQEEQIVQVKSWKEIPAEKADTVRLEPSGISIAGVEYAINYTNQNWWVKVANLTEHVIYLDKNDVIAYAQQVEMEPLGLGTVREVLGLRTVAGSEHNPCEYG